MAKYIFVTGGVTSSLGKGIISSSLAKLLQARGLKVTIQKFDPYINIDSGMLDPYEHGESYVTEDGFETDLDLGHYERFLNTPTSGANDVTTGQVYQTVIEKERRGAYGGKTVQVIPHITDEIKRRMLLLGKTGDYDVVVTELGGTVGDIESLPYIETVRQLQRELNPEDILVIHLTLIPYLKASKELKTKPTQHSVKLLSEEGVRPDIIVCRTERPLYQELKDKIALFCNVREDAVIEANDAPTIYEVPIDMMREGLDKIAMKKLQIPITTEPDMEKWKAFLTQLKNPKFRITVGLVGKYVELQDAYKSILESFIQAGAANECEVVVKYVQSEDLNSHNIYEELKDLDGILVASGFGNRGIEGKIKAARFARENEIPFLGIGLGMQCAVVEFARNVVGWKEAHSAEVDTESAYPVVAFPENQGDKKLKGKMRLGAYSCDVKEGTLAHRIFKQTRITERHRHRYEINNEYVEGLKEAGLVISGINPDYKLVEIIELEDHPFFLGVQFNPEYKSTVLNPHPLFIEFVKSAIKFSERERKEGIGR